MRFWHYPLAYARRRPVRAALITVFVLFCLNIGRYAVWPPVARLAQDNPQTTAFIEYRKAAWKKRGQKKTVLRTWKPLRAISRHLIKAVVAAEDSTFWNHEGFDLDGMREAMERNIKRGRFAAGGSTITQQLAKNLYFSPEKSVVRKIQEAIVAKRLEWNLSKERILELYLNVAEWGDGAFGAEAAARRHFGTSASRLTARQAATLAAMLPSPIKRKPGSPQVRRYANTILARMRIM
ncbi:monofunctional biosynthetic peptidoglycan transglycosylase [Desulfovibrio sp. OttesenSCG-928-O18]|nr:monofunctional biosynthetic peptidoglycan transglycosylase [Desulfovibrio sp. OttesenSCG-928-O18]